MWIQTKNEYKFKNDEIAESFLQIVNAKVHKFSLLFSEKCMVNH